MAVEAGAAAQGCDPGLIVVGVDGSDASKDALRWAADYASVSGGHLKVVAAWQFPPSMVVNLPIPEGFDPIDEALESVNAIVAEVLGEPAPVPVTTHVACGSPDIVLLEESPEADLLVVGSRGRGGFAGLLLGSTSEKCARYASCPVTIVRHQPEANQPIPARGHQK